jgi:hypothetical protein
VLLEESCSVTWDPDHSGGLICRALTTFWRMYIRFSRYTKLKKEGMMERYGGEGKYGG